MADIIYPYKKYNFKVVIDQTEEAGFSEVVAPDITIDPIEYREASTPKRVPGVLKYTNVTFRRGTTESHAFMNWLAETKNDKSERKQVTIILLDDEMNEVACWELQKAWPTKYTAPDFNSTSYEVAIESLELVCEGISRIR